jgi:hypothetical protein
MRAFGPLLIALLAACAGTAGSAASATPPPKFERVSLDRSGCNGQCPIYRVTLSRNGIAAYHGERFVSMIGDYAATIDTAAFDSLASVLLENHVFTMDTVYTTDTYDLPGFRLCVTTSEFGRCIRNYGEPPYSLRKAANAIDAEVKRLKWEPTPAPTR